MVGYFLRFPDPSREGVSRANHHDTTEYYQQAYNIAIGKLIFFYRLIFNLKYLHKYLKNLVFSTELSVKLKVDGRKKTSLRWSFLD